MTSLTATTTTANTVNIDDELMGFASDEFDVKGSGYPWAQWSNDKNNRGILVTRDNIEAVELDTALAMKSGWKKVTVDFDGKDYDCLQSNAPTLSIVRRGGLKIYERESGNYVGHYSQAGYDKTLHVLKTRYLIYLLAKVDAGYQLLHPKPLQLTLKGVPGAQFTAKGSPVDVVDQAVARHYGRNVPRFAFAVHLDTEMLKKGEGSASNWVCCIKKGESLESKEALSAFYVGRNTLEALNETYKSSADFDESGAAATNGSGEATGSQSAAGVAAVPAAGNEDPTVLFKKLVAKMKACGTFEELDAFLDSDGYKAALAKLPQASQVRISKLSSDLIASLVAEETSAGDAVDF